jgi:hypothetical protein
MYRVRRRGMGDCTPSVGTDPSGNPVVTYPADCINTQVVVTPTGSTATGNVVPGAAVTSQSISQWLNANQGLALGIGAGVFVFLFFLGGRRR